jgi:Toxin SymE, type I toxin-antitoxin system
MPSRLSDTIGRLPVLSRPRRRRVMNACKRAVAAHRGPQPRPGRAPYLLTLSARRIARRNMPEAVVPYLRMSGRWLEEHGFAIGSSVQVLVEHGRVTLISEGGCRR